MLTEVPESGTAADQTGAPCESACPASAITERDAAPAADVSLCSLARGDGAVITGMREPGNALDRDLLLRLCELGFVPGESVRVTAHGQPGNEPIAVRLGGTTFALRRAEAEFVRVAPLAGAAS